MSKVSFLDKLKAMKMTEFSFIGFEKKVSSVNEEGERITYLVFQLEDPIPEVQSSLGIWDPTSGKRVHDFIVDVTEVCCNLEKIEAYADEFTFEEEEDKLTGRGSYKGDMMLDLASSGNVWLSDEKISIQSGNYRRKGQQKKVETILERAMKRREGNS